MVVTVRAARVRPRQPARRHSVSYLHCHNSQRPRQPARRHYRLHFHNSQRLRRRLRRPRRRQSHQIPLRLLRRVCRRVMDVPAMGGTRHARNSSATMTATALAAHATATRTGVATRTTERKARTAKDVSPDTIPIPRHVALTIPKPSRQMTCAAHAAEGHRRRNQPTPRRCPTRRL